MIWMFRADGKVECSGFPRTVVRRAWWGTTVSERPAKPSKMDVLLAPQSAVQADKNVGKMCRWCRHEMSAGFKTRVKRHARRVMRHAARGHEMPVRVYPDMTC